jgi:bidirectional [NiFe] hydrogenase diaphorase subunit
VTDGDRVTLVVDGVRIQAAAGDCLLTVCLGEGIDIPHLCSGLSPHTGIGACRLCFVEVTGLPKPVSACTTPVVAGMVVSTASASARRMQRAALRLLLSAHHVVCAHCPANKRCELQRLARLLKVPLKPKTLEPLRKSPEVDRSHPVFNHYPNRCVLCGRCLRACRERHGVAGLTFAGRGFNTVISGWGFDALQAQKCQDCWACLDSCPVAALEVRAQPQ